MRPIVFVCYDLIRSDQAQYLSWKSGLNDFTSESLSLRSLSAAVCSTESSLTLGSSLSALPHHSGATPQRPARFARKTGQGAVNEGGQEGGGRVGGTNSDGRWTDGAWVAVIRSREVRGVNFEAVFPFRCSFWREMRQCEPSSKPRLVLLPPTSSCSSLFSLAVASQDAQNAHAALHGYRKARHRHRRRHHLV